MSYAVLLLVLLSVAVYLPNLRAPFIYDDGMLIRDNPALNDLSNIPRFLTPQYWNQVHPGTRGVYRPLREITFTLLLAGFGARPIVFHIFNLLLNAGCVVLVYALGCMLMRNRLAAIIGALFFALHPIHTEAVLWAKNAGELLAAITTLLAAALWLKWARDGKESRWWLVAAVVIYAIAFTAKEMALGLAPVLLLWGATRKSRQERRRTCLGTVPLWILALTYLAFQFSMLRVAPQIVQGATGSPDEALWLRPALVAKTYARYFRLLVLPVYSSSQHYFTFPVSYRELLLPLQSTARGYYTFPAGYMGWEFRWEIRGLIVLLALLAVGIRYWRRGIAVMLWPLVFLVPVSNLIPFRGRSIGEQRLYTPSVGYCLALGALFALALGLSEGRRKKLVSAALVAIMLVFGGMTVWRGRIWTDAPRFYRDMLRTSPVQVIALLQLGDEYEGENRLKQAASFYLLAANYDPDDMGARAHATRALLWRYLAGQPADQRAWFDLGAACSAAGKEGKAVEAFRKAVELAPGWADAQVNCAIALARHGQLEEAAEHFRQAIRLVPDDLQSRLDLTRVYMDLGDGEAARAILWELLELCRPTCPVPPAAAGASELATELGEEELARAFAETLPRQFPPGSSNN